MHVKEAMMSKNISIEAVARVLGIHRNSASSKVNGNSPFTVGEAFKLKRNLLREYDLDYLFDIEPACPPQDPPQVL